MTTLKFIFIFLLIGLYSCGQNSAKQEVNPAATALTNKIILLVNYLENADSCKKALSYLDSATTIDSNCFLCYHDKLMFLSSLREFDKAILAINNCIRIVPNANDLYLTGGILYAKTGDSTLSKKYFEKSLAILNPVLDTMNVNNSNYLMLLGNKAVNLIMLGKDNQLNELINKLPDAQTDLELKLKKNILAKRNMSKNELINRITGDQ